MQQEITELHALLKALGSKRETKVEESCQDDEVVTKQLQEYDTSESDGLCEPYRIQAATQIQRTSLSFK